ncbi:MAG: Arc family DNA-binding protein [Candidatus Marinimicrobia bacterium]|nr:Arc family DNA-binding protein [Candidatus Neomarinimicrobiota bacterium]
MPRPKARPAGEKSVMFGLRLPASIHAAVKKIAQEDDRSMNGQIVRALKQWLRQRERMWSMD